ncbi:TonB-dependent receptor [Porphyromonas macacae]|uniref:outer membrane beta-barrel protein n=1 Tax=Porphyromonas macacae TaxID=28115 RepID=UPI00052CC1C0|nr:outer membrane beta-barrel protein [Porphyromonas macacae]KGN99338.1 TonB-dependent receptor [Porphyromonas macacae]
MTILKQTKLRKIAFFCSLLFLYTFVVFSQTGNQTTVSYQGTVIEAKAKQPLAGATITLQTAKGVLLTGTISKKNGNFNLTWQGEINNATDSLILQCSFLGFDPLTLNVPVTKSHNVGIVPMEESVQNLQEVTVVARRAPFKFERGTYLAKISGSSLSKLSSANDVLKRLPLLTGDRGAFSVRGRGQALIYINRREVRDPSEIQNIDASQIESVRIITDPGVSYPIGTKAVIQITVKKPRERHLGVTIESELYQRKRFSEYHTLRANYTKNNLSVITLLRMEDSKLDPESDIKYKVNRPQGDLTFSVAGRSKLNRLGYSFDNGLNYDINDNQSLGYYVSASLNPEKTSVYDNAYRKNDTSMGDHTSTVKKKGNGINGTLYYIGSIGGIKINFQNFLYYSFNKENRSLMLARDNYFGMDNKSNSFMNDTKLEFANDGLGGNLNYGLQWTYTRRKDESVIHKGEIKGDDVLALQNLLGPFFSYNWTNEKLSVSAGLRMEWEKKEYPHQSRFNSDHIYYNPKIGINYSFSNGINSSLNWQTFTARPQYFVLSGIASQTYPFLYKNGNPFLKSTRVNNFNLDFSYKELMIQTSAKHISNGISSFYRFDEATQTIRQTFENKPTHWEYGLSLIYQVKPFRFWTIDFYGESGYANFSWGSQPSRDYFKKVSYFADVTNTFTLPHDFTINLYSGYFRSLSSIEESLGTGGISGSIDKFFFNRKLYISLNIGQYIQKINRMHTELDNIRIDQLWDTVNRYVGLTVKYTFNSVRTTNKASKGNKSEMQRF